MVSVLYLIINNVSAVIYPMGKWEMVLLSFHIYLLYKHYEQYVCIVIGIEIKNVNVYKSGQY